MRTIQISISDCEGIVLDIVEIEINPSTKIISFVEGETNHSISEAYIGLETTD